MAYKQKGCTPITAKLQKTTKGGMVQQPLLNMGAPVKMKMNSPAKQGGGPRVKAQPEEAKDNTKQIERLKLEIDSMSNTLKNYKDKGGKVVPSDANYLQKAKEKLASLTSENKPKKEIAIEKVAGGYFGNKLEEDYKPKETNRIDFPYKPKDDTPKETKVTGKIGSELRRQQYDKLGWKYDSTINAPKENKKVQSIKPNVEAKVVSMETKSEIVVPKEPVKVGDTKKAEKKIAIAENKESRAAKVRAKGEKALASGDKEKALKLKRREERINKRAAKKRSQASEAINPS
jgi:hypothetical protein